ncbi:MAG: hypothetical protein E6G44_10640 [Actinobacteria bacterium]|nr:MAG: hypothetical protein E6G44_10640 [Actinomycetota bacterium]
MSQAFATAWPGPGNSEGPVDPEGMSGLPGPASSAVETLLDIDDGELDVSPWPGPGDSEAPAVNEGWPALQGIPPVG